MEASDGRAVTETQWNSGSEREFELSTVPVDRRKSLPDEPGVYLFRDGEGGIIYIGKAKSVRKRVATHFGRPATGRAAEMISTVSQIDFIVTSTESEALITEHNLIKRHRPRFNVLMRDDKSYPYIGISTDEEYPRVYFTRERHRPRRLYFGPFSSVRRVRHTLDLLGKVFQYRTCDGKEPGRASGNPCLDYYIKRCQAPCVEKVTREEYGRNIDAIVAFLSGDYREVLDDLDERMRRASSDRNFEQAAIYRDRLNAVRSLFEKERATKRTFGSVDFIAIATEDTDANAQVFQVRDGILVDRHSFYLQNRGGREVGEVIEEFAAQYYANAVGIPATIVLQKQVSSTAPLEGALSRRRLKPVRVKHADRGEKRRILEMAERNARLALDQDRLKAEHRHQRRAEALDAIRDALDLDRYPVRLECFDVSNLGDEHTVASMVVFEGGAPRKEHYRHFKIRSVEGQDDFAAISEVLSRRLKRYEDERALSPHDSKHDEGFSSMPDVVVIDGGRGQLSSGIQALTGFRERGVYVVSLAKRIEEVFTPDSRRPLLLPHDSPALQLLQRLRDEAHRFAIGHHRKIRGKAMTISVFDELPGIGPARKSLLLKHFGSPERFMSATLEELEAVPGLPGRVARDLYRRLNKAG